MDRMCIGSEALRQGKVSRYQLRTQYRAIYPDVYVARDTQLSLRVRSAAAWLWTGRRGTLAGLTAAALHGSDWIDEDEAVELLWRNPRPPTGIITRNDRVGIDEVTRIAGLPVTTSARTAFDLGRQLTAADAIARLDALMRATPFSTATTLMLSTRYAGARGVRQLRTLLPKIDPGAASPKETWLRMLLVDAGLPTPETQIPVVVNYRTVALLDMGWERFNVAVEYDGDQHRTDRRQYVRDVRRLKELGDLGWIVIRVIAEDRPDQIVRQVAAALQARGYRNTEGPRLPRH
ncbi:endonuclease domain-containing protein [Mycobacterium sp. TY815]|uniref:endonuclease domain-containing protein n=1 Tax=Mycobacterium sp. TY815 TaxID=3050581 RepID=UPI00274244EE|nr:hypothetical protein [Mycobacterium sp. TY815]MDP7702456.1 hypothetical protein [Mycobacterium sp. TY815]